MVVVPAPRRNKQARRNASEPSPPGRLSDTSSADICKAQGLVEARNPPWEVLEREHPGHLECHYCRELHSIDKIHEYTYQEAKNKGPCWKVNQQVRTAKYIHPNFSLMVFRMVMKQYRQGKNCDKLLELLEYRSGAVMEGAQVKLVIATPKIVGERLLMRVQTAYVIRPEGPSQTYLLARNLAKCPHTNKWSRDNRSITKRLLRRFVALETVSGGLQEHVMSCQCNFCPTEFHFSLEQFEGQGIVLFITKWQDLGTGLSPSSVPAVVGRRRNNQIAEIEGGYKLAYESPRVRFEGLASREDLQAVSALSYEERKDLFRKSDSK